MLHDNFGRQFHYLRLSITDVCNFKCSYCLPDGYQCDSDRNFLTTDEIRRIVNGFAAAGTSKIRITGGEPALRKDLTDIIRQTKATKGIKTVALTTNGFNLNKNIADWVEAGLDALNVSIDSLRPDVFRQITGFDKLNDILAGLQKAASLGLTNIKINAVLLRQQNANQLDEYLDWIKNKPYTLRFIELMQTGDNKAFFDEQHVAGNDIKSQLLAKGWLPMIRSKTAGPAQEFDHPDYQGKIGLIMPYSKDFCSTCNRLRVSSIGKMHMCLFAEQGYDIRQYLESDTQLPDLISHLQKMLTQKTETHDLHNLNPGATKHLAMLGG